MFEKFLVIYQILLDPPKSTPLASFWETPVPAVAPLKKGDFDPVPPFLRGVRAGWSHTTREKTKTGFQSLSPFRGEVWRGVKSHATKREIRIYVFFFLRMKPPCFLRGVRGDQ